MKVLKATEKEVVFEVTDSAVFTEKSVRALEWAEGLRVMRFFLGKNISDEEKIVELLGKTYPTWTVFSAGKTDFTFTPMKDFLGITSAVLDNLERLREVYLSTSDSYHKSLGKPLSQRESDERDAVLSEFLPSARVSAFEKQHDVIALLVLVKWQDCFGEPVDWIPWVWINSRLPENEREFVRSRWREWLRNVVADRVQCVVEGSNIRSGRFFKRMGFHPECIVVSKSK